MKDKCERNRQLRGADDGNSKLCDDDVRRILASPECHARVARRHKIGAVNVQMIRDGKTWIHVERPAIAVGYEDGRFGENSVHHKLTHADALAILASGETQSALAKKYQVDQATISNIKRGKYWKRAYAEFHTGA